MNSSWNAAVVALTTACWSGNPDEIYDAWSGHHATMERVRGMFVVTPERYDKPSLPTDMDFGPSGRLRCLLIDLQESKMYR